jgi:hypothetical protein
MIISTQQVQDACRGPITYPEIKRLLFPCEFPQNAGLFMDNLGKIGKSLMDNWGEN